MPKRFRVTVDDDQCEANALCMGVAPEVFELDDDDLLTILLPEPPEQLRERVREAAQVCPKQAIKIDESPSPPRD